MAEAAKLLTVAEAAEYLQVSPHWIYQKKAVHKIPFVKIGGTLRFNLSDLETWIKDNTITEGKK